MKLDKIKFAHLINFIADRIRKGYILNDSDINFVDDLIDIEVPEPIEHHCYPKNENVERLMKVMAEGKYKIEAIKEHRAITGFGLKESKDAVERYWPDGSVKMTKAELMQKLNAGEFIDERNRDVIAAFLDQL